MGSSFMLLKSTVNAKKISHAGYCGLSLVISAQLRQFTLKMYVTDQNRKKIKRTSYFGV